MRCPECNTNINDNEQYCPNCGTPIPHAEIYKNDEPRLSKGLAVFIVIGTLFLIVFGVLHYNNHKNDPQYVKTAIDPDTSLADNYPANFVAEKKDTVKVDSTSIKEEEAAAEKVFNSIRNQTNQEYVKVETNDQEIIEGGVDLNTPPSEIKEEEVPIHPETTSHPDIEPITE